MTDEYERKARIYPALLTVAPISVAGVVFGISSTEWWQAIVSLTLASGFWFLAGQVGRSPGKRLETRLWSDWREAPTTILLRHRDSPNPVRIQRIHDRVAAVTGLRLPTMDEEVADPLTADAIYGAATQELIEKTRDMTRFPLLFKENVNYGFRRNMVGLRAWGAGICLAAAVVTIFMIMTNEPSFLRVEDSIGVTLVFFDVLGAYAWWMLVTPVWVKQPAFAYAERLLEATTDLADP